jgi:hypothetical protein
MKTIVYVDGLNLYYATLRGTAFKWLDLYALFQDHVLGAASRVEKVRYYTARARAIGDRSFLAAKRSSPPIRSGIFLGLGGI